MQNISRFHVETGSQVAQELLNNWGEAKDRFSLIMPRDFARVLAAIERAEREGLNVDEAVMGASNG